MSQKHTKRLGRSLGGDIVLCVGVALFAAVMALPMIYVVGNAFKPYEELFRFPPALFVKNPTLDNFKDMLNVTTSSWVPMVRYVFNTVFITAIGSVSQIIFATCAAYAITKFNFPGNKFLFKLVVYSLMFSPVVTSVPRYIVFSKIEIIDTYWAILIPAAQSTMGLYLMKQFMEQMLPNTLLEAARIDGAGELRIIFSIAMPVLKPAWLTLAILSIQALWNTTGGTYIYSEELKTLPDALHNIIASGISRTGVGAAVQVIMMLVPIFTFLISQSNIMQTMATSGMKD